MTLTAKPRNFVVSLIKKGKKMKNLENKKRSLSQVEELSFLSKVSFGSNIGDYVYLREDLRERFSENHYGRIIDCNPASNYMMNAMYEVEVYDNDGEFVCKVWAEWGEIYNDK